METRFKENISKNITKYFDLSNKKRADLAARLNTSVAAISRFCLGQSTPTVDQIVIICDFFEITLNELFGINSSTNLSNEEFKIIEALRDNPEASKYIKQFLNIK